MSKFRLHVITAYLRDNVLKGIKTIISKLRIRFLFLFLFLFLAFPVTTLLAAQSMPQTISIIQKGHQIVDEKTRMLVVDENKNEVSSISKNTGNSERYIIEFKATKNSYATNERSSYLPYSTTRVSQRKAQQLQLKTQLVKSKLIEKEIRSLNRLSNALVVKTTSENAKEISRYKGVKSIRKEYKYHASLDDSVPLINADEAWLRLDSVGQSVTGTGIKIAIIDTGIDYGHSALGACMGVECKVLGGYDFVNDDGDPMDDHGHGTHVAGIAAANSEQIKGVAPDALLYAYKSLNSNGSGWETDIIAAIEAAADPDGNPATDDAVDIINMSLGGIDNGSSLMDEAVKEVVEMGVTVVVAAGNDGIAPNFSINRNSLANEPSVITVGATTKQDRIAYFSSTGHAETTTHLKPEISAPGSSILSTVLGNNLEEKNGTSMAAPHVAGAAALILQSRPDTSPALLKRLLMAGAIDLGESPVRQGIGRIDVEQSLNAQFIVETDLIHLGKLANTDTNSWSVEKTLIITNIQNEELSIQLTMPNKFPAEISFELSETDITLAANSSIELTLSAEINDVANFPFPNNGSYIFFDGVSIESINQSYHLPIILDRSYSLNIVNSSNEDITISAFPFNGNFDFNEEVEPNTTKTIPVAFEKALIKVQYGKSYVGINQKPDWMMADAELIGYEVFTTDFINGQDTIELDTHFLTQIIGVGEISSSEIDVDLSELETKYSTLTFDGEFHYSHSDHQINTDNIYYQFGRISPDVSINYQSVVNFKNDDLFNDNKSHFYSIAQKIEEINQDSLINLNLDTDTQYEIQLDESVPGVESVIPNMSVYGITGHLPKNRDGFVFHTTEINLSEKFYVELGLVGDIESNYMQVSSTGRMWFTNDGLHKVITNEDYNVEKSLLTIKGSILEASAKGTFFNPQISKLADNKIELISTGRYKGSAAFIQDLIGNLYSNALNQSYIWHCDGEQEEMTVSSRGDHEFSIELTSNQSNCSERSMTISFDSFLDEIKSRSSVKIDMEDGLFSEFPSFFLQINSGDELVTDQIVNKDNSALTLVSDSVLPQELQAYIRLDSGEWIELQKNASNSFKLSISEGSFTADIRLVATGYEQTLNGIFYIGSDAGVVSDFDSDGIPDDIDSDDDNDGVEDHEDAFPFDYSEQYDTDNDGIGNNADTDDDNDGVNDDNDAFPLDPSESVDTDNDGIGNNADTDDDADGVPDSSDAYPLDSSRSSNSNTTNNSTSPSSSGGGGSMYILLFLLFMSSILRFKYRSTKRVS